MSVDCYCGDVNNCASLPKLNNFRVDVLGVIQAEKKHDLDRHIIEYQVWDKDRKWLELSEQEKAWAK